MKVTLLKKDGRKEVINRIELADLAAAIKNGMIKDAVRKTRELYHLMNPHRLDDGQITTQLEGGIKLPRICFVADYMINKKKKWCNYLCYTTLIIDIYYCLSLLWENYLTSSKSASWMSSGFGPCWACCWPPWNWSPPGWPAAPLCWYICCEAFCQAALRAFMALSIAVMSPDL